MLSVKAINEGNVAGVVENVNASLSISVADSPIIKVLSSFTPLSPIAASIGAVFGTGSTVNVIVSLSVSVPSVTVITISV